MYKSEYIIALKKQKIGTPEKRLNKMWHVVLYIIKVLSNNELPLQFIDIKLF